MIVRVVEAVGPLLVALSVLVLPLLLAAVLRRWSRPAVVLYLLSLALLGTWTAKAIAIADSSYDSPPPWPALAWMLAALAGTAASVTALLLVRTRRRRQR
ncbi:hypothetical protein [Kineococcus gypseus]|uniref:hypothetical protein n=1 Tax=Kineococcus gypseus TaxID=1637102 RepID=UPI003D7DF159